MNWLTQNKILVPKIIKNTIFKNRVENNDKVSHYTIIDIGYGTSMLTIDLLNALPNNISKKKTL